jgi:hypothetical protein
LQLESATEDLRILRRPRFSFAVYLLPHEAYARAARALVDAHVGAAAGAERSAREALRLAPELGSYGGTTGRAALALLALSLERPNDAHDSLAPLVEH